MQNLLTYETSKTAVTSGHLLCSCDLIFQVRLGLRNREVVCLDVRNPGQHFSKLQAEGGDGNFVGGGMIGL